MTDSLEVEEMAAKLTEAQRRWLPEFGETPIWWFPVRMAKRTRQGLIDAGLLEVQTVNPRDFPLPMKGLCLTPLGLAVRQHLQESER